MNSFQSGIIELEGIRFTAETRTRDCEKIPSDRWELDLYDQGAAYLTSVHSIRIGEVFFRASVFFPSGEEAPEITLYPVPDDPDADGYDALHAFQISSQWLREQMGPSVPSADEANMLAYQAEWGQVYTVLMKEREYGWEGGTVEIRYSKSYGRIV